jgi:hypothetical protein
MVMFSGALGLVPSLFECTDELHLQSEQVPPRELFKTEHLPTDIFLTILREEGESGDTIWSAFEALEERVMPPRAVCIHIMADDFRFTWVPPDDIDAEEAIFFARALRHAIALAPRGISILDDDGKDMRTMFGGIEV